MKLYSTENIRTIGLVGHGSEGKTTLAEAMLYNVKAIDRMGRTEDGNTVTDYDPEEIKRGFSVSATLAPVEWKNTKINVIDIPGYFDLIGEMAGALRVVESALIVVGSVSGLEVGAEKAWDYCEKYGISRMFFVNQMDRENANFAKVVGQLQDKYGTSIVAFQIPIMNGEFSGYVDVIENKAYLFDKKGGAAETAIPDSLADQVVSIREGIVEAAASADEDLMEKYFDEGDLGYDDLMLGLKAGIADHSIVPVVCGSALTNSAISALMDAIVKFMPSPEGRKVEAFDQKTNTNKTREISSSLPFSAFVYKTVADNFVGKLSFFKVMSGELVDGTTVYNANTDKLEKINHIYVMQGKKQVEVPKLAAGDIGALAKLTATNTSDTLCDQADVVRYAPIEFPVPSFSAAISAAKQGDEDKVFGGLTRLMEEDPSFKVEKSSETADTLISGQGELHLAIIVDKLDTKFNAKAVLSDPKVPYRETIRKKVQVQGRHKKQSGGHGQFGDIWVEFEPILDGSSDFEFVDKIVGGVVPRQYIPAVEKGLRECITKGVLVGCPVVNLRATLYDGSYHAVDSSEMAFKTAAHLAFRKGCTEASPVLLEPIMKVVVTVPDDYMGDVIGDMNRRRGRIMGMNPLDGGLQEVVAEVPQSEIFKYATDLRSMTQARGSFLSTFERYDDVPSNIAQKVIEQAKKDMEEEE